MPSLRELRSALGAFATDKNDEELLQLASTAMGVSPGRIASEYGYKPTASGIAGLRTGAAIDQYQAGLYGLGEAVTGADFFRRGRQANEFESNVALERARAQGAIGSFEEVQGLSDIPSYLGGLAIGSAPYAIEALGGGLAARGLMTGTRAALGAATAGGDAAAAAQATRALRAGQTAGGVAAAYPSAVGGILQAQREQAGETDLSSAAALGVPFAALNALGIEGALARQQMLRSGIGALDNLQGLRGGFARAGAAGVRTGLTESGTETLQEMATQIGRMAVDPNEAFLSDAALGRYKESAIGGAFLGGAAGGLTGFGRSEQYRPPVQERDLTLTADQTPPADPGKIIVLPNGRIINTGAEAPKDVGLKKFVDETTGVVRPSRKGYEDQFKAAFNEPSGQYTSDPTTGIERELTVGELVQRNSGVMDLTQDKPAETAAAAITAAKVATARDPKDIFIRDTLKVIPNQYSRQLFDTIAESGIDPQSDLMVPVWNYAAQKYMGKGRYEKAVQLMDEAIIKARKGAPSGTPTSTGLGTAGSVGVGGAVVPGAVGTAGSASPVQGTVGGTAAGTGAPLQQASVLPNTSGQPSTTVTTAPTDLTAPPASTSKFRRAPKPMTVLEAANAAKAAQAQQTETQRPQESAPQPVVDERQVLLQRIFGERNGDIIFDVIGMGMSEPDAAAKYGLKRASIQKIAGATGAEARAARVAQARTELGLTDEQIRNAFAPPEQDVLGTAVEREIFGQTQPSAISEGEAIEGGLENFVNTAGAGTSEVEGFTKLQKEIDATLEALAAETDEAKLEELNAKLAEQIVKVRAVEKRAQAEVRATAGKDTSTQVGETDAVQVTSTALVPVQPEAETGKGVGKQVRRVKKPTAEGQTQGQAKEQIDRGKALWESLSAKTPGLVPYEQLNKLEQDYLTDLAVRTNGKPVVSKEMGLQQLLTREPVTIDVESRIIDEQVTKQVAALPAPQIDRLEQHYGNKRDSAEFLAKVQADITKYVTQGAEAVAGAIRSIIKAMAEGVLAMGIVFNPNITKDAFTLNVAKTFEQTIEVTQAVPAVAKAQMSPTAQAVYEAMAPVAMKSGKWFMVADKPNGMLHIFKEDGSHALSDPTLYGKDTGDVLAAVSSLEGGAKVTPAGTFTLKARPSTYAGGQELILVESKDYTGYIAIHAADTSTPSENRLGRLDTPSAADNRVSYGCINTKHDTFINEIAPNIANLDGGMVFVVPDAQEQSAQMFAAETRTETRTEDGQGAKGVAAATVVGKEETIDVAVNRVLRLTKGDTVEVTAGTLKFDGQITDEASLRRFPGVESALSHYENNDLRQVIDDVELWMVAPDTVDFDAAIMMVDGKQTLAVRSGMLVNSDAANWAIHHELGHIADAAFTTGGIFSGLPEFNLTIQKGVVKPMGSVVSEVMAHMNENPNSDFTRSMGYPLDHSRKDTKNMSADETRMEVFAQLWAFYNTREGNAYLADNLPLTYDFMEASDETAKQNKGGADAQTGAAATETAPQVQAYRGTQRVTPAILRIGRPSQGVIQSNISKLPKASQSPVRNIVRALGDLGGAGLDYVVFTSDLIKRAVDAGLTSAQTFADALAQRRARVSEFEREIERIADGYADIEPEFKGAGRGSVNDFLFESTRTLKWGYDSGKIKADPEMAIAFNKLGPKAQKFVKNVFAHGDKILSQKKQSVLKSANSEYDAMIQAAQNMVNTATDAKEKQKAEGELAALKAEKVATLKRFQTLFAIREGKPYAPIKRDGAYVVIGKSAEYKAAEAAKDRKRIKQLESDPDHYHVSFVDTKWAARTLSDNLAEQGVFEDADIVKRSEAFEEAFSGEALLPALTKIRAAVDKRDDSDRSKMLNIVSQLYLEALAEGSARKSEMRRRGVAGEVDMLQAFTRQGRADANFLANVEFEPLIQDALQQMRNDRRGGNRERKSEIFDELTKRYVDSLETKGNGFITGLTNTASKYFLASSPAYYMQNLTQPFMMSLPALAGRHDYTKAGKALFDAYAELGPLFKDIKLFDQQFDFSKVPADVRAAITKLVNQGQIDIGLATEINEYKVDADSKLGKFAQRLNKSMRLAVQKVEATNRLSTAIAAYRLEFARTKDAEKATQYAADILTDTHGDYTAMNAPRIFNSQWGKVALQFRKFQLIQIAFYAKLLRDAFTNPAERTVAMRTLAFSLGHTAVFAGMMGLPGYAAIAAILGFFGDEDEPYDLTADMRQALGPEWSDLIMRGAPTLVGVDLSGKIGAGNMLSIMPFSDADLSTTAGRAEAFGTLVGGASLGMVSRVADGMGLILSGDYYKGVERTMPKGVSDALKAGRQAAEGMTRRNGDVVLPADEVSAISAVLTGLGVPSVKETVVYERQNRMRDVTQNFQDRTTRIKNDYAKAVRENDGEAKQEAREAWQKLQRTRQENGLKPQPLSNLLKAPQEQREREKQTVGGVAYRQGQRKLAESVAEN